MSHDRYKHEPVSNIADTPLAKFKPLNGYVLCEREVPTKAGAIFLIPKDTVKTRRECTYGTVIKTGALAFFEDKRQLPPGERKKVFGLREPLTVKEGDRILIDRYAGHDITIGGKDYVLCKEHDIHVIIGGECMNIDDKGELTASAPSAG